MDGEKGREVAAWLRKARSDLDSARILAAADPPPRDVAVYHCQQAAEKAFKAWLVARDIPFPKTHDLQTLLTLAGTDSPLQEFAEHARVLTPYAVEFRYPGDLFEPDEETCVEALRLAGELHERVCALLG